MNLRAKDLRFAIYSRVSTAEQNTEPQMDALRHYCKARGFQITHEISDRGWSGSTDQRPGLKELMRLVRSRQVDGLAILKLDRLFRSLKHMVSAVEEFNQLNVLFLSVDDNIDASTASGRLMLQIVSAFAEFEKSLLVERTLMGLAHAKSKGRVLGRPKTRNDQAILELRAKGLSYSEIQKELKVSRGSVSRSLKASRSKTVLKNEQKPKGNK